MSSELSPDNLKFRLSEKKLKCPTTEGLTPLKEIIGQDRAVKAGKKLASGKFPKNTENYRVSQRIKEFANKLNKLYKSGEI